MNKGGHYLCDIMDKLFKLLNRLRLVRVTTLSNTLALPRPQHCDSTGCGLGDGGG